jgi:ankyrin repeat protein
MTKRERMGGDNESNDPKVKDTVLTPGMPRLLRAVLSGDRAKVSDCLDPRGKKADRKKAGLDDLYGKHAINALMIACELRDLGMAELLLDRFGADPEVVTPDGRSALFYSALGAGHVDLIRLVVRHLRARQAAPAAPAAPSRSALTKYGPTGDTPLSLVCKGIGRHLSRYAEAVEMIEALLSVGAHPRLEFECSLVNACYYGNLPVCKVLIENGADIHICSEEITPLVAACRGRRLDVVRMLLDLSVNPNQPVINEMSTLLAAKGVNVNLSAEEVKTREEMSVATPLEFALLDRDAAICEALVERGGAIGPFGFLHLPVECTALHLDVVRKVRAKQQRSQRSQQQQQQQLPPPPPIRYGVRTCKTMVLYADAIRKGTDVGVEGTRERVIEGLRVFSIPVDRELSIRNLNKCETCDLFGAKFQKCGRCKSVLYCCRSCQAKDWPLHKLVCRGGHKKIDAAHSNADEDEDEDGC